MSIEREIKEFYRSFKGTKGSIGFSAQGRPIWFFRIEKTSRPLIIVQCAIHAREFITARFCLKEIADFSENGKVGCAVFIPCLNPDGVEIAETTDPLYKANANGVDLNVNFDARWGTGDSNVKMRGSANFIGERPFSEPETKAIRDFTLSIKPDMTVSYHTKGEEIYYRFFQENERLKRDRKFAQTVAARTGYRIVDLSGSAGGYKDWCVEKLKIPAITVEAGKDSFSHPLDGKAALNDIMEKNIGTTRILAEGLYYGC